MGSISAGFTELVYNVERLSLPRDIKSHSATTSTSTDLTELAEFETTSRLIASLVNEKILHAEKSIHSTAKTPGLLISDRIWVATTAHGDLNAQAGRTLHPADLKLPVLIESSGIFKPETNPQIIASKGKDLFKFEVDESAWKGVCTQLENSAQNQDAWFQWASSVARPTLNSNAVDWERALVTGHPAHPMHRSCIAQSPLKQVHPTPVPSLLYPSMSIIKVDSASIRISGPYRHLTQDLFRQLGLHPTPPTQVYVPCLTRQLPAILANFKSATVILEDAFTAEAQASIPLACTITSALRTITPWTCCVGPELSTILEELVPSNLWIAKEVASVTGAQDDYDLAKHISCVLQEDLEPRATAQNQALIVCAALSEKPAGSFKCHAELVFDLKSLQAKEEWFKDYSVRLTEAILVPVLESGICLEAHGQNMLVRVDRETKQVKGFAVRDCGGVKCHMPTLHKMGYHLMSALPGSFVTTDDEQEAWDVVQHTLVQNHLQHLMRSLGIESGRGWVLIRETICLFLDARSEPNATRLREHLVAQPTIHYKAFLTMKMHGLYRDYEYVSIPNPLFVAKSG